MIEALRWTMIVVGSIALLYGLFLVYVCGPYWRTRR